MCNDNETKRKALSLDVRLRNALDGLCPQCSSAVGEMLRLWENDRDERNRETQRRQSEEERKTEYKDD
jgi:hypothetical protein